MSHLRRPGRRHGPAGQDGCPADPRPGWSDRWNRCRGDDRRRARVMTSLADKLRGIVAAVPASRRPSPEAPVCGGDHADGRPDLETVAEVLGGTWQEAGARRILVVDRVYRPGHRHGHMTVVDHLLPEHDRWCGPF